MTHIAVIGGGAAGFFAAITCKQYDPAARVTIFEKSSKLLSKVKVSGGGRCNVTNSCKEISRLVKHYPRGEKPLKKVFSQFGPKETIAWFEQRGVALKTEADGRIFPVSDDSQTIIDCLINEAKQSGVVIQTNRALQAIEVKPDNTFDLSFKEAEHVKADRVIVATGGSPKEKGLEPYKQNGHKITSPVPSLFTFNMPGDPIRKLMGVSVEAANIRVTGTKLSSTGPLLITHWGMSGPAILKLSAFGARILYDKQYHVQVQVNWLREIKENELREQWMSIINEMGNKKLVNANPWKLPSRLWHFLLAKSACSSELTWSAMPKKTTNKLINTLLNDTYDVKGKTTFKEEFVTCGGVSLQSINMNTMQSTAVPGMFFAGELIDADGITGGFNFQQAWSTGYVAGKNAAV